MEQNKLLPLDLSEISQEVIEVLLLDSTVVPSFFDEVARRNVHRPLVLRFLLDHPKTPDTTRKLVAERLHEFPHGEMARETAVETSTEETATKYKEQTLLQRVQRMKVGEKIQLALRGGRDIRSLLMRDPNKEVMLTVLENTKITDSEIEIIAKQKTSSEDSLRIISKKKEWMKKYSIVSALVSNPKTPTAIAMKFVSALKAKDLSILQRNKNIPEAVRMAIRKRIMAKQQR